MKDIEYIEKRIREIYKNENVIVTIEEHERTYELFIELRKRSININRYEVDKNIESVGYIINYICKDLEKREV